MSELDAVAAGEIGSLVALLEAIDSDLAERGLVRRTGEARSLLKLRLQASRRLQEWLDRFGLTPRGRAEFARDLAAGRSISEALRERSDA